jgi:hypothetical protein
MSYRIVGGYDQAVMRARTTEAFGLVPKKDLHWIIRAARRELKDRHEHALAWKERLAHGWQAFATFLTGVAHAMACRALLRRSKEHTDYGKGLAAGHMWTPAELLYCVRDQVRALGWHPITSDGHTFKRNYIIELQRKQPVSDAEADAGLARIQAAQFQVRMSKGEARRAFSANDF